VRYPAKETAAKHERILKEASRLFWYFDEEFEDRGSLKC
jgi:hypothetical protein